jgi:16S rRNA (cytosine1402-N4)-methyltransferase
MKELSPLRQSIHIPVMPEEVISFLDIQPDGIYVDGTCGLGGHSKLILSNLSSDGFLISIDLDQSAIEICKENLNAQNSKLHIEKNSYSNLPIILDHLGVNKVNGILLDLGLSSMQLDSIDRGFSFSKDSYLDMRFDQSSATSAAELINKSTESELADMIYHYGEERRSRAIAKKLIQAMPIASVQDLVNAVKRVTPPHRRNRTMARVFQAFRIAVNKELEKLSEFLSKYSDYLEKGGKIIIISFHSLEDRLVKRNFKEYSKKGLLKILTKKPLIASDKECESNSRSRSAKLRCAEKIL